MEQDARVRPNFNFQVANFNFHSTPYQWLVVSGPMAQFKGVGRAPVGVQQKLMRYAQISTTMNIYGNAMMESKREANTKVVRMALRPDPNGPKSQLQARHRMRRRAAAGGA